MCRWVSSGPASRMMASMSPPWWKVWGAQYRKLTRSLSIPRIRLSASWPFSTKSSGCGSSRSCTPSRSKTGSSSSSDRHPGRGQRLLERGDGGPVGPWVDEERDEVLPRRQLDVLVAELGHHARQLGQRDRPQHVRVEGDLHGCGGSCRGPVLSEGGVPCPLDPPTCSSATSCSNALATSRSPVSSAPACSSSWWSSSSSEPPAMRAVSSPMLTSSFFQ